MSLSSAQAAREPEEIAKESRDRAELRRKALSLFLLAILCSLFVFTIMGDRGAIALYRRFRERRQLAEAIKEQEQKNAEKLRENQRLQKDPKALETIAREQLDMVKPGEIMFVLPEEPATPTPAPTAAP